MSRSNLRLAVVILFVLLLGNLFYGYGEKTSLPRSILEGVISAYPQVSYEGVRISIYWLGPDTPVVKMRVAHQYFWERVESIDPPPVAGRIIIRQGNVIGYERLQGSPVWCSAPGEVVDLDLLFKNYEVNLIGEEEVAGRPAHIMEIRPRFPGRPSKVIWVDQQKFIILKNRDYSAEGKETHLSFFVEIDFKAPLKKEEIGFPLPETKNPPSEVSLEEVRKRLPFPILIPSYLPSGFILQRARVIYWNRVPVLHLGYVDGLGNISLFEEPGGRAFLIPGFSREVLRQEKGETKIVRWRQGKLIITLVSELSWEEVEKIVKGIIEES